MKMVDDYGIYMFDMNMKFIVFQTDWGYFGLAGDKNRLYAAVLPQKNSDKAEKLLSAKISLYGNCMPEYDKTLFPVLKKQIIDYFSGKKVNFDYSGIVFPQERLLGFSGSVLQRCIDIKYGETKTYGELALAAGSAKTFRAAGGVLSRNILPLIIPCHRVIRADGSIGGFSADGGAALKARMLELEAENR
jgi:O-6-methylguanine DNA methyltransferase